MRRILAVIVLIGLATSFGCITPEDKAQWNEAVKDLRGDNTQMKYFGAGQKRSTE